MKIANFSLDFFSLKGKTAVVTGGNSGLGQAFALALAKAGANILVPSLLPESKECRSLLESAGTKIAFMQIDLTEADAAKRICDVCLENFGTIDILVNNAGICTVKPVLEFGRKDWDAMINLNLNAAFALSHETARTMVKQKSGKIINICSLFSFLGGLGSPAYAASKHALVGLTKSYCDELASSGIQVNGIAPGYYATDITKGTRSNPESNKRVLDHIPANRWGELQDLMGTVVFLASRASDYVNGHVVVVDGGYLVR